MTPFMASVSRRAMFFRAPATSVIATVLSMFAMVVLAGLLSAFTYAAYAHLTGEPAEGGARSALAITSYILVTASAVLLIALWRRLAALPLSGLGVRPWVRLWLLMPGFIVALGVSWGAAMVAVGVGAAAWDVNATALSSSLGPLVIVSVIFGQALPEELLWRGHLLGLLRGRLSPVVIILVTSIGFGLLHVLSSSDADNAGEQLLYVLQATMLGYALIAFRMRTGSLWTAVGFHTGYNVSFQLAISHPGSYWLELLVRAAGLAAVGTTVFLVPRMRAAAKIEG